MDIHSILSDDRWGKKKKPDAGDLNKPYHHQRPTISEIPDVFFDEVLLKFKLNRVQILILMYLYRAVWTKANIYKKHGISPILSYSKIGENTEIPLEEIYAALRKLEQLSLIHTLRPGQYFVRKYFLKEFDDRYGQTYDDFEI